MLHVVHSNEAEMKYKMNHHMVRTVVIFCLHSRLTM